MAGSRDDELTIDALAQRIGMTVRNIRAHQSRGLLPPPEVRGRTGYYGREHVERLQLIQQLQADGFSLDLIRRLLAGAGASSASVLRFSHALRMPFADEEPEIIELADLAEQWGTTDLGPLQRAEELGLLRRLDDGRIEMRSPRLAAAGLQLRDLGVSLERALDVFAGIREQADRVAETYIALFMEAVWMPFEEAGRPDERWPEVQAALERLRPLASESVLATFGLAMGDAVEAAFGRELQRLASQHDADFDAA